MSRPGQLYFFSGLFAPPSLTTAAIASATPRAAFSIGSRLASIEGGMPEALLNGLLGLNVSANLVDYRELAGVDVKMFNFLDALASRVGLSAGTYSQVLATDLALADIAGAMGTVLNSQDAAAAAEATLLSGLINSALKVRGNKLISLGDLGGLAVGTGGTALGATVGALEMISVAGALANGRNQAALQVSTGIPLIGNITLELAVGEPAQGSWFAMGQIGTIVRTAQVRMKLVASVGIGPLGLLANRVLHVPLYFELAPAQAELSALTCPPGNPALASATIATTPGIARLMLGEIPNGTLSNFGAAPTVGEATLLNVLNLVKITGSATISSAAQTPIPLTFSAADVAAGTVRTATVTTPVGSLAASLISGLDLNASPLAVLNALLGPTYEAIAKTALTPLGPAVDAILVSTLDLLGVKLGQADVRVHGFDCRHAVLVQ